MGGERDGVGGDNEGSFLFPILYFILVSPSFLDYGGVFFILICLFLGPFWVCLLWVGASPGESRWIFLIFFLAEMTWMNRDVGLNWLSG